jgi:hypothetical protein
MTTPAEAAKHKADIPWSLTASTLALNSRRSDTASVKPSLAVMARTGAWFNWEQRVLGLAPDNRINRLT